MSSTLKINLIGRRLFRQYCALNTTKCYKTQDAKATVVEEISNEEPGKSYPSMESTADSLAARGFSRASKDYNPPSNPQNIVKEIFQTVYPDEISKSGWQSHVFKDSRKRFKFLTQCEKKFDHTIPNTILYQLTSVAETLLYFSTPVACTTPYLNLQKKKDLPKNLSILPHAHRFHPDTDNLFGGVTAFPESTTIVSSIKYKKMYKGYVPPMHWKKLMHLK